MEGETCLPVLSRSKFDLCNVFYKSLKPVAAGQCGARFKTRRDAKAFPTRSEILPDGCESDRFIPVSGASHHFHHV
jgi:hypothetical protein